jgi:hypothetical protein
MESSGAGGRNGGLPSKAGVIGVDHIHDRKIPLAKDRLSLRVCQFFPFDSTPVIEINQIRLSLGLIPRGGLLVSFQKRRIGVAS